MDWLRIGYWISLIVVWIDLAIVWWLIWRNIKRGKVLDEMRDAYVKAIEETWVARDKYYEMIEEYRKRGSDEGSDNDYD